MLNIRKTGFYRLKISFLNTDLAKIQGNFDSILAKIQGKFDMKLDKIQGNLF